MNITCKMKLSGGVEEGVIAHSVSDCATPVL